jgi:hypothetical protein
MKNAEHKLYALHAALDATNSVKRNPEALHRVVVCGGGWASQLLQLLGDRLSHPALLYVPLLVVQPKLMGGLSLALRVLPVWGWEGTVSAQ